jgi:hypothetical protein
MAMAEQETSQGAANQKPITTHGDLNSCIWGYPWHSFSCPDPKKKKEPNRNLVSTRPYVADASSLFHPDLVLVFPYAIRKCTRAHPAIAMLP